MRERLIIQGVVPRLVEHRRNGQALACDRAQRLDEVQRGRRVEAGGGLVQEEDGGLGHELCPQQRSTVRAAATVTALLHSPIATLTRLRWPPEMPRVSSSPMAECWTWLMPSTSITVSATCERCVSVKLGGSRMLA